MEMFVVIAFIIIILVSYLIWFFAFQILFFISMCLHQSGYIQMQI